MVKLFIVNDSPHVLEDHEAGLLSLLVAHLDVGVVDLHVGISSSLDLMIELHSQDKFVGVLQVERVRPDMLIVNAQAVPVMPLLQDDFDFPVFF